MTSRNRFTDVLTAAVADIAEHGYDSAERVAYWSEQIRKAAEETMTSAAQMEESLRAVLGATYRRLIENGQIARYHQGIARFTIDKVKPALRAELDRRIMANANLIRLNRKQAIDKTLARFAGWSTSIPKGGSAEPERAEAKATIKKALSRLPFQERFVLIDQGHKLVSALSEIVATDGGAIAGVWHDHGEHQAGYDYRPEHMERSGKVFLIRGSWAHEKGLVKPGPAGYTDQVTRPAEEPFCFPGDLRVPFANGVEKAYRRWYSGQLTKIVTASGKSLCATPNHPVLTSRGWVAIGSLDKGDNVVEIAEKNFGSSEQNQHNASPTFAQIFSALREFGISEVADGKVKQFHGDGSNSNVDIVSTARELWFGHEALRPKRVGQFNLAVAEHCRTCVSALQAFFERGWYASSSLMRFLRQTLPPFYAFASHAEEACVASPPRFLFDLGEMGRNNVTADLVASGQRKDAFAAFETTLNFDGVEAVTPRLRQALAEIDFTATVARPKEHGLDTKGGGDLFKGAPFGTQTSRVVKVNEQFFSGHVYNLQTESGWYVTEGIITHNCRCRYSYVYNLRSLPDEMLTVKGREALAEARRAAAA